MNRTPHQTLMECFDGDVWQVTIEPTEAGHLGQAFEGGAQLATFTAVASTFEEACIALVVARLAAEFSNELRDCLTANELRECVALNAIEADPMVCHSQDHCDANQCMLDAMDTCSLVFDPESDGMNAIMDRAWTMARNAGFSL